MRTMSAKKKLGDFIERIERTNDDGKYGLADVRGVSNTKQIQATKANMEGRDFRPFLVVKPGEFVFNRRTTRNGERLGLGYNTDSRSYIFTEDYVAFRVKDTQVLHPDYLYLIFLRDEFDRYVRWDSWGSATEFFNWENMLNVPVSVPRIEVQRSVVAAWQGLREMQAQNERLAATLMPLCRSYLQDLKHKYKAVEIGEFIEQCDERNSDGTYAVNAVRGISIDKKVIPTKANMDGVSLTPYKLFKPKEFCFVTITSRNGGKISLACNEDQETHIVSSSYEVFRIKDHDQLDPGYLSMLFRRAEFDRYARFNSWGSAREAFSFADMRRVKIPFPPMEIQRAIVEVFQAAQSAKRTAAKAAALSKGICPALIQKAIHS